VRQSVYVAPEVRDFLPGPFVRANEILDWLSTLVAPYPYEKLAHLQSSTRFGGMENASAIFYADAPFRLRTMGVGVIAHETAHQWFGNSVTPRDWPHLWLSEGFATYFEEMWVERTAGAGAFRNAMAEVRREIVTDTAAVRRRPVIDSAETDYLKLLNTNSYQKGGWVLHMLRGLVGDSAFFGGIREYYRQYRDSTVLSSDFAAVMSRAAGQDLEWYFRQALTQPGYPELRLSWQKARGKVRLVVDQVQDSNWGVFRIPHLTITADGKPIRVSIEGQHTETDVDLDRTPAQVQVDPDGWWLVKVSEAH